MSDGMKNGNEFIGFEYKGITVKRSMEPVYADGYANFGWVLDGTASSVRGPDSVTMKFKRDRKVRNKAELTRLQHQFDSEVAVVSDLERSKSTGAFAAAFSIGIIGTAFMAGSVFAYIGGMTALSVVLAVPAFLGWALPYFVYTKVRGTRTEKIAPLVERKYDDIYGICEKAHALLAE